MGQLRPSSVTICGGGPATGLLLILGEHVPERGVRRTHADIFSPLTEVVASIKFLES